MHSPPPCCNRLLQYSGGDAIKLANLKQWRTWRKMKDTVWRRTKPRWLLRSSPCVSPVNHTLRQSSTVRFGQSLAQSFCISFSPHGARFTTTRKYKQVNSYTDPQPFLADAKKSEKVTFYFHWHSSAHYHAAVGNTWHSKITYQNKIMLGK